jgi:3-hydroxyisobutyrate dehydrogenase-like beta-hydroxyacid dehydrogenase
MSMARQLALLHPGEMGVTIGSCALASGITVGWTSDERSETTVSRANDAKFTEYNTLQELLANSNVVFSVCPPAAAAKLATRVAGGRFKGLYIDANAVSPTTAATIADIVESSGASYVDGGIIGPPAYEAGTTRLYLSGAKAREVTDLFKTGPLEAIDIGKSQTSASALKVCYAAWTKGSAALLLAVGALAQAENVADALRSEWAQSLPDLSARLENVAKGNAPKAWRFENEMHEIADTFEANGLPSAFHRAAAVTYALLSEYKGAEHPPSLDEVLRTLLEDADI